MRSSIRPYLRVLGCRATLSHARRAPAQEPLPCKAPGPTTRGARTMAGTAEFGLTGLAVMGQNLARNVARNGIPIVVHNRTYARTEELLAEHGGDGPISGARTS